jgi:hypothetical protein
MRTRDTVSLEVYRDIFEEAVRVRNDWLCAPMGNDSKETEEYRIARDRVFHEALCAYVSATDTP